MAAPAVVATVLGAAAMASGSGVVAFAGGLASIWAAIAVVWSARRPLPVGSTADPTGDAAPVPVDDPVTDGVFTETFLAATLRSRVAVARRALRPLSLVFFEVLDAPGEDGRPLDRSTIAEVLATTLRESDVAGPIDDATFVCILEDTGEDGAVWTAERIRRNLSDSTARRRFRAGVASYPSHGLEPEELREKAWSALVMARDWSRDRIEVAVS